jgi:hypothetical protein
MSLETSQSATLARLEDKLELMEERIVTTVHQTTTKGQDYEPEQIKPSHSTSLFRRGSLCSIGCTCSCHSAAKFSWNIKTAIFRSIAGIAIMAYSGRGSQACLNPMC